MNCARDEINETQHFVNYTADNVLSFTYQVNWKLNVFDFQIN